MYVAHIQYHLPDRFLLRKISSCDIKPPMWAIGVAKRRLVGEFLEDGHRSSPLVGQTARYVQQEIAML